MTTFLLSVDEAWSRIGRMVAFLLSVGAPGSEHFLLVSFFIYLAFCFVFKLSVGVSGSVPEREHDHLFHAPFSLSPFCSLSACRARSRIGNVLRRGSLPDWELASPLSPPRVLRRGGSVPDWESASPRLHPRVSAWVGLGPGWEWAFPLPPPAFRRKARSRIGNWPLLFHPPRVGVGLCLGLRTGLAYLTPYVFRRGARFRIGNGPLLFCTPVPALGSVPD